MSAISPTLPATHNSRSSRWKKKISKVSYGALVVLVCAITFFPIYWMIVTTLQPTRETLRYPPSLIPRVIDLTAYRDVLAKEPIERWILNSIYLASIATIVCVLLSIIGGYAISSFQWKGKGLFAIFLLMTQMLPEALIIVPIFKIYVNFPIINQDIRGSLPALALLDAAFILPICVWVMKNIFDTVPKEVREAAVVDGATPMRALFQIVLPITLPGVVAVGVVAFFYAWNEFLFAQTMIQKKDQFPASVGLASMITMLDTPIQRLLAAGLVFAIPPVVFYILMQRYIVAGIASGAVKG
ncbi:carbohydrate ABC transporter permease [soil metagenome]